MEFEGWKGLKGDLMEPQAPLFVYEKAELRKSSAICPEFPGTIMAYQLVMVLVKARLTNLTQFTQNFPNLVLKVPFLGGTPKFWANQMAGHPLTLNSLGS